MPVVIYLWVSYRMLSNYSRSSNRCLQNGVLFWQKYITKISNVLALCHSVLIDSHVFFSGYKGSSFVCCCLSACHGWCHLPGGMAGHGSNDKDCEGVFTRGERNRAIFMSKIVGSTSIRFKIGFRSLSLFYPIRSRAKSKRDSRACFPALRVNWQVVTLSFDWFSVFSMSLLSITLSSTLIVKS